jgi:hypothetical protein
MEYQQARPAIRSGDLIAFTHKRLRSFYDLKIWLVRMFTASEYSHVAIAWEIGGRLFVIESVIPYVRIVPLSNFKGEGFYHVPLNTPMSDAELEFALSKVGNAQYSQWQAVLAQFRGIGIGKDDLWECAELVITARALSGVDLEDKATPTAVVQAALRRPDASLRWVQG